MFYFQHHFPLPSSVLVRFPQGLYLITAQGAKRLLCSTCVCLNMINICLIWKGSAETLKCSWFHFHYTADQMHKNYTRLIQQKHKAHLTHRERGRGRKRERANGERKAGLRETGPRNYSAQQIWRRLANSSSTIFTQFKVVKASKRAISPPAPCRSPHVGVFPK